jgi:hypothetical protein
MDSDNQLHRNMTEIDVYDFTIFDKSLSIRQVKNFLNKKNYVDDYTKNSLNSENN